MDKIWDRKSFEVGGHWPLWWGWKNRMTTQNRHKSNAKKRTKNPILFFIDLITILIIVILNSVITHTLFVECVTYLTIPMKSWYINICTHLNIIQCIAVNYDWWLYDVVWCIYNFNMVNSTTVHVPVLLSQVIRYR